MLRFMQKKWVFSQSESLFWPPATHLPTCGYPVLFLILCGDQDIFGTGKYDSRLMGPSTEGQAAYLGHPMWRKKWVRFCGLYSFWGKILEKFGRPLSNSLLCLFFLPWATHCHEAAREKWLKKEQGGRMDERHDCWEKGMQPSSCQELLHCFSEHQTLTPTGMETPAFLNLRMGSPPTGHISYTWEEGDFWHWSSKGWG